MKSYFAQIVFYECKNILFMSVVREERSIPVDLRSSKMVCSCYCSGEKRLRRGLKCTDQRDNLKGMFPERLSEFVASVTLPSNCFIIWAAAK